MSLEKRYADLMSELSEFQKARLVAVSKRQNVEKIRALFALGQKDFAENYLQEALEKQAQLQELNLNWHYVGRIQSKKIKDMVGRFVLIHSVSRWKEMEIMSVAAQEVNLKQDILLQVNIAEESSKQGFSHKEVIEVTSQATSLVGVQLRGLMVFPPLSSDPKQTESYFAQGQQLFRQLQKHYGQGFDRLSMGTSRDYLLALRQGATDIRVGESLMGARPEI